VDDGGALRVRGTVVHGVGTAAVGALVRYRGNATRSDDRGAFELVVKDWSEPGPLVAVLSGFQAAIGPDVSTLGRMGAPDPQRLVLGPPPLAIAGRVVDHEGRPQAGWTVQPVDPVVLEEGRIPPECVEELTLGAPLGARTDADGAFELLGLQDRAYRLQAHSAKALVRVESEPIPAGARNVRVLVPADARFARIDGVVVGLDGTPVAGVGVRPTLIVLRTQSGYTMEHADGVTTDAEGRFALVDVPRQSSRLDVDGDAILPASHALDDHQDGTSIRIQVARRKHLRVEGIPPESGVRWVSVLDGSDQELQLMQFQSGGWASSTRVLVQGGAIPVVSVAESARTIVFSLEHPNEVRRPITLAREGITTVRW
jgi:hypothetical protein